MVKHPTNWLLLACYTATATGSLLALHLDHHHAAADASGPGAGHAACCRESRPVEDQDHPAPAHRDCALCDALASTTKTTVALAHRSLPGFVATRECAAHVVAAPHVQTSPAAVNPRAPPLA